MPSMARKGCIPPSAPGTEDGLIANQCFPARQTVITGRRDFVGPYSPGLYCPAGWSQVVTPLCRLAWFYTIMICLRPYRSPYCSRAKPVLYVAHRFTATSMTTLTLGPSSHRYVFMFPPGRTETITYTDSNTYTDPTAALRVPLVVLLHQSSDFLPRSATTSSAGTAGSPSPSLPAFDEGNLSMRAKIGIGVAAGVAAILALLLAGGLLWYQRKRRQLMSEREYNLDHGARR
ncbi:hypothetical protein B0T16DRAFT_503367 [Cercophora newfieldiana]|uniref:Uncharacterized protein n=1 Tax=Cercophora newfieldiana TaxID=92897 RepID=A0AA39YF21_9PEZI|nr:hypothetical protein B0T16DRAFT_503367 [Cercophora newfieldiana]